MTSIHYKIRTPLKLQLIVYFLDPLTSQTIKITGYF